LDARHEQAFDWDGGDTGGILGDKGLSIEYLAEAALAGIHPESFLNSDNEIELAALTLVANEAISRNQQHRQEQAILIINYLGRSLKEK
jgi:hypothetical protein